MISGIFFHVVFISVDALGLIVVIIFIDVCLLLFNLWFILVDFI